MGCKTIKRNKAMAGYAPVSVFSSASFGSGDNTAPLRRNDLGQIDVTSEQFEKLYKDAKRDEKIRNYIITQAMLASDEIVEAHKKTIVSGQATTNAGLSIGTSALAGLSTILSPTSTKSALSGGAAFLNATRSTVNEQFYLNQLSTGIIREITLAREETKKKIVTSMALPTNKYTIDMALSDLRDYHERGSMLYGLVALTGLEKKRLESRVEINQRIADMKSNLALLEQTIQPLTEEGKKKIEEEKLKINQAIAELILSLKDAPR